MISDPYCRFDHYTNIEVTAGLIAVILSHCVGYGTSPGGYSNAGGAKANKPGN